MKNRSIKAKKVGFVNQKTLIATADIGKNTNMGYFLCPDENEIKPFKFTNNIDGLTRFWDVARMTKARYGLDEIKAYEGT